MRNFATALGTWPVAHDQSDAATQSPEVDEAKAKGEIYRADNQPEHHDRRLTAGDRKWEEYEAG